MFNFPTEVEQSYLLGRVRRTSGICGAFRFSDKLLTSDNALFPEIGIAVRCFLVPERTKGNTKLMRREQLVDCSQRTEVERHAWVAINRRCRESNPIDVFLFFHFSFFFDTATTRGTGDEYTLVYDILFFTLLYFAVFCLQKPRSAGVFATETPFSWSFRP